MIRDAFCDSPQSLIAQFLPVQRQRCHGRAPGASCRGQGFQNPRRNGGLSIRKSIHQIVELFSGCHLHGPNLANPSRLDSTGSRSRLPHPSLGRYGSRWTRAWGNTRAGGFQLWAIREPAGSSFGRYGIRRAQALGDTRAGGFQLWAIREPVDPSLGQYGSRRVPALGDTGFGGLKPWAIREPAGSSFGRYGSRRVQALGDTGFGGREPGATCVNSGVSRRRHASRPFGSAKRRDGAAAWQRRSAPVKMQPDHNRELPMEHEDAAAWSAGFSRHAARRAASA